MWSRWRGDLMGRKGKQSTLTIDEAFQRFYLQEPDPHVACERFNQALREGLTSWCDGKEVEPDYFASYFRVVIKQAPDGGWTAKMKTTATTAMPPADQFEWTVSASAVGRYVPKRSPTMREDEDQVTPHITPGPKAAWRIWVTRWLILKASEDGAEQPQNVDVLVEEAREYLRTKLTVEKIFVPKDSKPIRGLIKDLLVLIRH
jgi:hypothetical protein